MAKVTAWVLEELAALANKATTVMRNALPELLRLAGIGLATEQKD